CGGLIDALSFWCAGLRNVTAVSRAGEISDLREVFERYDTERVLLAFDDTIADTLIADGLEVHRVEFPLGDDANDHLRNTGFDGLKQSVQAARRIDESPDPRGDIWRDPGSLETPDREGDIRREERAPEASSGASERALEMDSFSGIPDTSDLDVEIRSLAPDDSTDTKPDEVLIRFGDRRWRVRGLERNLAFNSLKVNLLVSRVQGDRIESFHIDTFDLYSARHRNAFCKQAAEELGVKDGVIRRDLGKVLLALEELQEAQIRQVLEPVEQ
ncbi:MAG: toprim domain-containing protein, partial [Deltaproteobacteria bacterium]|nr:toprim domain-containing protein [Deltaproteobacteria bacterium]